MNKTPVSLGRDLEGASSAIWMLPSCSDMARANEELPLMKEAMVALEFTASDMTSASIDRNSQVSLAMRCRTSLIMQAVQAQQQKSTFEEKCFCVLLGWHNRSNQRSYAAAVLLDSTFRKSN